jgi:hypothetical protein
VLSNSQTRFRINSASKTVPEVVHTKAMLTTLRIAIEITEMRSGDPELLARLDRLVDLRFFDISIRGWRVRPRFACLTLTDPCRVRLDLQRPSHELGQESLSDLVNQS